MDDLVTVIVACLVLAVGVAAVISGFYILWVKHQTKEDELYLTRLINRDLLAAFVPVLTDLIVMYFFLRALFPAHDLLPLQSPYPAIAIGVSVMVMRSGVIADALQFFRDRRA